MKLPLRLEGHTIWDADGRVIVSALNPCNDKERRQIVDAVNATMRKKRESAIAGREAAR